MDRTHSLVSWRRTTTQSDNNWTCTSDSNDAVSRCDAEFFDTRSNVLNPIYSPSIAGHRSVVALRRPPHCHNQCASRSQWLQTTSAMQYEPMLSHLTTFDKLREDLKISRFVRPPYINITPDGQKQQTDRRTDSIRWHYPHYCYCMVGVKTDLMLLIRRG